MEWHNVVSIVSDNAYHPAMQHYVLELVKVDNQDISLSMSVVEGPPPYNDIAPSMSLSRDFEGPLPHEIDIVIKNAWLDARLGGELHICLRARCV